MPLGCLTSTFWSYSSVYYAYLLTLVANCTDFKLWYVGWRTWCERLKRHSWMRKHRRLSLILGRIYLLRCDSQMWYLLFLVFILFFIWNWSPIHDIIVSMKICLSAEMYLLPSLFLVPLQSCLSRLILFLNGFGATVTRTLEPCTIAYLWFCSTN